MKNCIYLRKSRADMEAEAHGEGETLARHERILLDTAKKNKMIISKIYKEIVSGESIATRPVMQELLSDVENGMWDNVLVVEVERLARGDTIDQGIVAQAFKYSNTNIVTPVKTYNPNNEFDEEYFEFGLFMSRREYKTINRRLNAGRVSSIKEGKYVGNVAPYGYKRVKLEHEKGFSLEPLPEEAEIVKYIFNAYINGIPGKPNGHPHGAAAIAKHLTKDLHIPARKRTDWTYGSIKTILDNETYTGKVVWGKRKQIKQSVNGSVSVSRPRQADYLVSQGIHKPLIDEDTFNKVAQIKAGKQHLPCTSNKQLVNPLAGFVYCSKCGRKMTQRTYNQTSYPTGLICPYNTCTTVGTPLYLVEDAVIDFLKNWVRDYELEYSSIKQSNALEEIQSQESIVAAKEKELKKLEEQKNKIYDLLEQGIYSTEIFMQRSANIDKQIADINNIIKTFNAEIKKAKLVQKSRKEYLPKVKHLLEVYYTIDSIEEKNNMLKELIDKIVYTKTEKNKRGEGHIPKFTLDIYPKLPKV